MPSSFVTCVFVCAIDDVDTTMYVYCYFVCSVILDGMCVRVCLPFFVLTCCAHACCMRLRLLFADDPQSEHTQYRHTTKHTRFGFPTGHPTHNACICVYIYAHLHRPTFALMRTAAASSHLGRWNAASAFYTHTHV